MGFRANIENSELSVLFLKIILNVLYTVSRGPGATYEWAMLHTLQIMHNRLPQPFHLFFLRLPFQPFPPNASTNESKQRTLLVDAS
jgi:hypothetical protein